MVSSGHSDASQSSAEKGRLQRRIEELLKSRWMPGVAGLLGFLEATFVFFPMEPLFLPMMASRHRPAWLIALFLLIGNVLGGLLMYGLGVWLTEPVVEPLIEYFGLGGQYNDIVADLNENGFAALFVIGITPVPYQLGTLAAGITGYSLIAFVLAISLARGLRYFGLAMVMAWIGLRAGDWIARHEGRILLGGMVLFAVIVAWMVFAGT